MFLVKVVRMRVECGGRFSDAASMSKRQNLCLEDRVATIMLAFLLLTLLLHLLLFWNSNPFLAPCFLPGPKRH